MGGFLQRLSISQRLLLIGVAFTLPIAVMVVLIVSGINSNIRFASWETKGNRYQRPLEALLEKVPEHAAQAQAVLAGNDGARAALAGTALAIDEAFARLAEVDESCGEDLQFTEEGLAKRNRSHVRLASVRQEWDELKKGVDRLAPEASRERHDHLVADVRTMIVHAGDTSNLILDPDLDSYYLMDATLVALPQAQDRLARVIEFGRRSLNTDAVTPEVRTGFAVHAAQMQEGDFDRIAADVQTSLNEDAGFHGPSSSLQTRLPAAQREYAAASERFITLNGHLAASGAEAVTAEQYVAAGEAVRTASFALWNVAADELDSLLEARIADLERARLMALGLSGIALALASAVVLLIIRSINGPLRALMGTLKHSGEQVGSAVSQLATASQSLAVGASEQAASMEETSASLEQISSMTQRNAGHTRQALDLTTVTSRCADASAIDMQEMTSAMRAIQESSDGISHIIKTIDDIAFQTNILALNAAVEAARAGSAGAGFAVVAEEVRNLARRSAEAAKETGTKIADSIAKSHSGVEISAKVADNLEEIATRVHQIDDVISEIAKASAEQSSGLLHVNDAVGQIDRATQNNAASAEEGAGAAQELSAQSVMLSRALCDLSLMVEGNCMLAGR